MARRLKATPRGGKVARRFGPPSTFDGRDAQIVRAIVKELGWTLEEARAAVRLAHERDAVRTLPDDGAQRPEADVRQIVRQNGQ